MKKIDDLYLKGFISCVISAFVVNMCIYNDIAFPYFLIQDNIINNISDRWLDTVLIMIYTRGKQFLFVAGMMKLFSPKSVYRFLYIMAFGIFGMLLASQIYYRYTTGLIMVLFCIIPYVMIYLYAYSKVAAFSVLKGSHTEKRLYILCLFVVSLFVEYVLLKNFNVITPNIL